MDDTSTLIDCFDLFTQQETLKGDNRPVSKSTFLDSFFCLPILHCATNGVTYFLQWRCEGFCRPGAKVRGAAPPTGNTRHQCTG